MTFGKGSSFVVCFPVMSLGKDAAPCSHCNFFFCWVCPTKKHSVKIYVLSKSKPSELCLGTRQIYCFRSGHRQSGQPPRTKERSECQQWHATILHHSILNLMFNAVNHPPSQIHIHTHSRPFILRSVYGREAWGNPSATKTFSPTEAYRKRTRKSINNLSDSIRIIILILISFQQLSFEQALSKLRICWWQILSTDK